MSPGKSAFMVNMVIVAEIQILKIKSTVLKRTNVAFSLSLRMKWQMPLTETHVLYVNVFFNFLDLFFFSSDGGGGTGYVKVREIEHTIYKK